MKIYYWSPHTSYVATIKAVINSALSLAKYGNKNYQVAIIDANGEWEQFESKKIRLIKLYNKIYLKTFPIYGYLNSRISYLYIFLFNFFSLKKLKFGIFVSYKILLFCLPKIKKGIRS